MHDGVAESVGTRSLSAQPFSSKPVDRESFEAVELSLRQKLPELVKTFGPDMVNGMFTAPTDDSRGMYDFDKYTVGAAVGWGGAQLADNLYESSPNYPAEGCYSATFEDSDNGAFWSFTVYDENGFMFDDVAHKSLNVAYSDLIQTVRGTGYRFSPRDLAVPESEPESRAVNGVSTSTH